MELARQPFLYEKKEIMAKDRTKPERVQAFVVSLFFLIKTGNIEVKPSFLCFLFSLHKHE